MRFEADGFLLSFQFPDKLRVLDRLGGRRVRASRALRFVGLCYEPLTPRSPSSTEARQCAYGDGPSRSRNAFFLNCCSQKSERCCAPRSSLQPEHSVCSPCSSSKAFDDLARNETLQIPGTRCTQCTQCTQCTRCQKPFAMPQEAHRQRAITRHLASTPAATPLRQPSRFRTILAVTAVLRGTRRRTQRPARD
jgi:hypothetical protein